MKKNHRGHQRLEPAFLKTDQPSDPFKIRRGDQANVPLGVALVGGGRACYDLLRLRDKDRLTRLKMKILGVSDVNQDAPGLRYARELHLFATTNMDELFALEGLNLIIELTGSASLKDQIYLKRPSGVSVIDHKATRLLWDPIQIEMEKTELERERRQYLKNLREKTQSRAPARVGPGPACSPDVSCPRAST